RSEMQVSLALGLRALLTTAGVFYLGCVMPDMPLKTNHVLLALQELDNEVRGKSEPGYEDQPIFLASIMHVLFLQGLIPDYDDPVIERIVENHLRRLKNYVEFGVTWEDFLTYPFEPLRFTTYRLKKKPKQPPHDAAQ